MIDKTIPYYTDKIEHRVVGTGSGAATTIGIGVDEFWEGLETARNGVGEITHFESMNFRSFLDADVKNFHTEVWIDSKSIKHRDRFTHFTAPEPEGDGMVRVMEGALKDANLSPLQVGFIMHMAPLLF